MRRGKKRLGGVRRAGGRASGRGLLADAGATRVLTREDTEPVSRLPRTPATLRLTRQCCEIYWMSALPPLRGPAVHRLAGDDMQTMHKNRNRRRRPGIGRWIRVRRPERGRGNLTFLTTNPGLDRATLRCARAGDPTAGLRAKLGERSPCFARPSPANCAQLRRGRDRAKFADRPAGLADVVTAG